MSLENGRRPGDLAPYAEREARRARRVDTRLTGTDRHGDECVSGHPALWNIAPAFELDRLPEGGGYPTGFVELAARLMGAEDLGAILHLCSGSVVAPLTIDLRPATPARIRADVRWLPIRPGSQRFILADPPYGHDYAGAIWDLANVYPTPTVLLRECAQALAPGGRVGLLHHIVPTLPDGLVRVGTWGVTTGAGYRIRAFTVAERSGVQSLPGLG